MAAAEQSTRDLWFDGAPYPALMLDTAGTLVAVNPAARELLAGLGHDAEPVGHAFHELLAPQSRAVWSVALGEMGDDGRVPPTLMTLVGGRADRGHVLLAARAWPDESGARAAIHVSLVDLAGRLHLEDQSHETANRYRSIMETARDAILTVDGERCITLVNGAAREMFGAPGNALIGRGLLDLVAPESRAELEAARPQPGGDAEGQPTRLALTCVRLGDGSHFPVDVSVSGFRTRDGWHGTVIIRDETERERLRRELEVKARQLQRKNEELEAFSYSVSHALKAPLRTMGSFASLLRARYRDRLDETGAQYLAFLVETCDEQARQIEQLLDMSHLARSEDAFEPVDLQPIVRKILDYHLHNAAGRGFEVHVSGRRPTVVGQRVAFYHLFDNLIGNAVKFTAHEPVARVEIRYEADVAEHRVTIADNGVGIAPEHQATIFRLFGRLHRKEEFEGTGAGLNIVLKILERHGGHIDVESAPGEGTAFVVHLPRRDGDGLGEMLDDRERIDARPQSP